MDFFHYSHSSAQTRTKTIEQLESDFIHFSNKLNSGVDFTSNESGVIGLKVSHVEILKINLFEYSPIEMLKLCFVSTLANSFISRWFKCVTKSDGEQRVFLFKSKCSLHRFSPIAIVLYVDKNKKKH